MISCSLNFAARHQADQEPSAFPCTHFALTNRWPGNNKLESFRETRLALRHVCTQTHEEIPHTQIVGGLAKSHHPLEAAGGGQQGPFSWDLLPLQPCSPCCYTAPCPTSHRVNPSPVQWALGPQRALCCPPLPQGDHSPVPGLATSQNWRVLWGRPPCQSTGSSTYARHSTCAHHIPGAETKHPAPPCTFDRNQKNKLIPRTQYYSCSLRNCPKVCALQVINVLFT